MSSESCEITLFFTFLEQINALFTASKYHSTLVFVIISFTFRAGKNCFKPLNKHFMLVYQLLQPQFSRSFKVIYNTYTGGTSYCPISQTIHMRFFAGNAPGINQSI